MKSLGYYLDKLRGAIGVSNRLATPTAKPAVRKPAGIALPDGAEAPSTLDFQIAAARLQDTTRDCRVGDNLFKAAPQDKVWVQIFLPNDPPPPVGSRIAGAAMFLIESIVPGYLQGENGFVNTGSNAGPVLSREEIARVRRELAKQFSKQEPAVPNARKMLAPPPLPNDDCVIEVTPPMVKCGTKSSKAIAVTWDRTNGNIYFLRQKVPPPYNDILTDELALAGFKYWGILNRGAMQLNALLLRAEKLTTENLAKSCSYL